MTIGREPLGQVGGAPFPHSYNDISRVGLPHPHDGKAMGIYKELYVYDYVGNLSKMQHFRQVDFQPAWTRNYVYEETSLIENGRDGTLEKTSNRLTDTTVSGNHPSIESYEYDNHGNIVKMPQLQVMQYDHKDQLCMSGRQKVNDEDDEGIKRQGERTYYTYDFAGQENH